VTFRQYNGAYTLETYLKATPANSWTTGNGTNGQPNQNPVIPNDGDQTVHFNLWRSGSSTGFNENADLTVEVAYFAYQPLE
jgi:hypothetical protein